MSCADVLCIISDQIKLFHCTMYKQVFRVKKLVGLPPQLELLADSVTSQVHDNLFKFAHTESIGMHTGSLMQGHTDTNRLCNYFFLSFAHSELH